MLFGLQTIRCEHPCLLATLAFVGAENFDLSLEIIDGRGVETIALTPLLILLCLEIQVPEHSQGNGLGISHLPNGRPFIMARSVFVKANSTKVRPPPGSRAQNSVHANVFMMTWLRRCCAVRWIRYICCSPKTNFDVCASSYSY